MAPPYLKNIACRGLLHGQIEQMNEVEEMIEAWDWESAAPTGVAVPRSRAHMVGIPHEGVHLWILRLARGEIELLFQKRAPSKASYPGLLDITVGGHVPFGLTQNKVQKESMEEIGIMPSNDELIDLGICRYEAHEENGRFHREFTHVYMLHDERPLDGYTFTDGEVTALAAVRLSELKALFAGRAFCEAEFYDGSTVSQKVLRADEFHPLLFAGSMRGYMDTLLSAAEEFARGGKVTATFMP
jgi:isopentenyldiphosphate isomerase